MIDLSNILLKIDLLIISKPSSFGIFLGFSGGMRAYSPPDVGLD
jgi:hypothetical protein